MSKQEDDIDKDLNFSKTRKENRETAILYRVDERTLTIVNRLERLQEWSERQDSRLSVIENKVNFHQSVIKGILFVLAAIVTALVGNIVGFIGF